LASERCGTMQASEMVEVSGQLSRLGIMQVSQNEQLASDELGKSRRRARQLRLSTRHIIKRNDPCGCGSGRKSKKCCLR